MTSLIEIYRRFPTKEDATAHLEKVRWPKGLTCVYYAEADLHAAGSDAWHYWMDEAERLEKLHREG